MGLTMRCYIIAVLLLTTSTFLVAQNVSKSSPSVQDLTPDQKTMVERLSNLQKNFGSRMNSPGVQLTLQETGRSHESEATAVKYRLVATGFPKDATYTIVKLEIDGSMKPLLDGVTLNANGQAICAGREGTCSGNGPDDPIDLVFMGVKSEPQRLSLISDDKSHVRGFVQVVPFPNTSVDRGCRLESIVGTPKGEITYIQGSGFEPNEELVFDAVSYGEKNHAAQKANADGTYFTTMLPNVAGKQSGTTKVTIKGKNCAPELSFSWGTYHLE